ncbi:MAG TPA: hypothetical protein VFV67_35865 [Actinophytocola sp.]|uniref:hypothetical protein n=1 Tax=Actinophytocola sp. TaxID=1872138 RepID=UPI002DB5E7CA|nr:hypothetical protein [Actinophytocola sp.]HEU5476034.1 hypothetical protein [Actinophytocola sp.]
MANRDAPARDRREPEREFEPRDTGPELPDDAEFSALDAEARRELRGLSKAVAEIVGRHLVAAGLLVDEDPERALEHARYARSRASRVAIVREAAGLAAYHAGEWAEALAELRAARRMSGGTTQLAVMADCERALGRPERALELAAEADPDLPRSTAIELRIVAAGARRDMGQLDAAVVALQGPDLDPRRHDPWSARLFYAYADNLAAAGRTEDAIRWFLNAAEADDDEQTDAPDQAIALGATLDSNAQAEPIDPAPADQAPAPEEAEITDPVPADQIIVQVEPVDAGTADQGGPTDHDPASGEPGTADPVRADQATVPGEPETAGPAPADQALASGEPGTANRVPADQTTVPGESETAGPAPADQATALAEPVRAGTADPASADKATGPEEPEWPPDDDERPEPEPATPGQERPAGDE